MSAVCFYAVDSNIFSLHAIFSSIKKYLKGIPTLQSINLEDASLSLAKFNSVLKRNTNFGKYKNKIIENFLTPSES